MKRKPALIVWGEADDAFCKGEQLLFRKHLPDQQLCLLPKAKHFIQENAPEEISQAIQ